jgi:hypothetical protein
MTLYLPFVLAGLVVLALIVWSVLSQRGRHQAQKGALEQLGFRPCPDQKNHLEETITCIENNQGYRYEVRDPKQLSGERAVYHYIKMRHRDEDPDATAVAEEEILFPLKRPSAGGLALTLKPSSLGPGLATRLMGAIATGPWDAQPDDLHRLELPPDLKNTNLVGALGPPGAKFYDLIDTGTLSVVQGLGDAGGILVRFRDAWCTVAGTSTQIPFRLDELLARIRPLL